MANYVSSERGRSTTGTMWVHLPLSFKLRTYRHMEAMNSVDQDITNGEKAFQKHTKHTRRFKYLANKVEDMEEAMSRLEAAIGRQCTILKEVCNALENNGMWNNFVLDIGFVVCCTHIVLILSWTREAPSHSALSLKARSELRLRQLISRALTKYVTDCSCERESTTQQMIFLSCWI